MRLKTVYILICATLISCFAHAAGYQSVRIVAPEPDVTVHDNSGNLAVTVALSPQLSAESGDHLVLLLDDRVVAGGSNPVFELTGIDRGSHTLRVRVEAADGTVLATSPPVTFHMWRASRLFKRRSN